MYDIAWLTFWAEWFPLWDGIDFRAAAFEHYGSTGQTVDHFAERLRACELDIGVGNLGWFTSRGDHANLERVARKTRQLAAAPLTGTA